MKTCVAIRALARLAVTMLLAACAGTASDHSRGRTLIAAIAADPTHLNPAITTGGGVHMAASLLYDGLVDLDEAAQPIAGLAYRWEIEDHGALYRFHLRRDVVWHDGRPFTAHDVTYSFEHALLRFHARTRASLESVLVAIEALDDSTVEFRFRRPYAPLLQQLNVVEAPILPRHVFAGTDPQRNPANHAPIGTGPFRFVSHTPDAEIRYVANAQYFRGRPAIDQVILRVIPDAGTQVLALEAGEVDWLFAVPGHDLPRLRRNPRLRFLQSAINPGGSNCIMTVAFNLDRRVLQDLRVRKALAHAASREQFLERVLFGEGDMARAPISSAITLAHAAGLPVPEHDLAEADRLLESAGWVRGGDGMRIARGVAGVRDGTRLTLGFKEFPTQSAYGNLLRAQWREAGVDLRLEPLEPAVFVQAVFNERDFDTAIFSYCNGTDPEIGVRRMYVSSNIAPVPFSNSAGYRNAAVDSLFDLASSALDVAERRRLYREIQELVVRDQPYIWLVETIATRAYNARCEGFGHAAHFAASARCTT